MKASLLDYQRNWLARYDRYIRGLIKGAYPGYQPEKVGTGSDKPLWAWVAEALSFNTRDVISGIDKKTYPNEEIQFIYLKHVVENLPEDNKLRLQLMPLLESALPVPVTNINTKDNSPRASLLSKTVNPDEPYEVSFLYINEKTQIARKNNLRWLLEHQKALLLRLKNQAWWAKLAAILYGVAIGASLAGFMVMFIGLSFITANLWLLAVPIVLAWFPFQTNFWISRRVPSELIFDLFTSPRETKPFVWNSIESWRSLGNEWAARFLGLCNACVYGGLTAYGMWELFTVIIGVSSIFHIVACAVIAGSLALMVFLPELGFGIKFNRQQLETSPLERYRQMKQAVNHDNQYIARFWFVFACVLVGALFTAMAAGSMVATLLSIQLLPAQILLGFVSLTVLPFYFDKAIKNPINAYKANQPSNDGKTEKEIKPYVWAMRLGNASMNAIPAFLGGLALIAGGWGIALGVLTGLAGFVASYLSLEDGETKGYEDFIDAQLTETNNALKEVKSDNPEAYVQNDSQNSIKATQHPILFRPFNTTPETRETELNLIEAKVPGLILKTKMV